MKEKEEEGFEAKRDCGCEMRRGDVCVYVWWVSAGKRKEPVWGFARPPAVQVQLANRTPAPSSECGVLSGPATSPLLPGKQQVSGSLNRTRGAASVPGQGAALQCTPTPENSSGGRTQWAESFHIPIPGRPGNGVQAGLSHATHAPLCNCPSVALRHCLLLLTPQLSASWPGRGKSLAPPCNIHTANINTDKTHTH